MKRFNKYYYKTIFKLDSYKQWSKCAIICVFTFLCHASLYSQPDFRFGLKIHPTFSFSKKEDPFQFDKANFSIRNGLLGFNFGLVTSFQKDNWIVEISSGLNTNKTGVKFKYGSNVSQVNLGVVSFTNEINIGYRILSSDAPYYEIFLMPNLSYSFTGVQQLNTKGAFSQVSEYQAIFPDINTQWESVNVGFGIKVRTQLKNRRRLDYGLSYRYSVTKYPEVGMKVVLIDKEFKATNRANVQTLNIDFIYYFGKKKISTLHAN